LAFFVILPFIAQQDGKELDEATDAYTDTHMYFLLMIRVS